MLHNSSGITSAAFGWEIFKAVEIAMIEKLDCFYLRESLHAHKYGIQCMPCTHAMRTQLPYLAES
jgi:hypothetical protein